jgi:hypothetical protein
MRNRCERPEDDSYRYYGALGVKVCARWRRFENFLTDMGEAPEDLTLERIDPWGDYEKDNCKWATWSEQRRNQRRQDCR